MHNIDLWEAWVDIEHTTESTTATLYVIGEICVNNTMLEPRFEKLQDQSTNGRLFLEIVPNILCENGLETEILYSEKLDHPHQYNAITIMVHGEVMFEINDLEFLYG
ncbi:hypothetical protein SAMN05444008_10810 [Cnuella takakiae]|uniref:Uncharacterized protein n=1 Tax=Cnuella takakiae TaxID=1302690 RepID=A0A1M5BNA1_9BACT|nr:hypothetical protein [Cnuella takakiae]SHF43855.1 hypothetical protein SAMN05444008_10810 [Cnuella takakiae]